MKRLLILATVCVAGAAHSAQLFYSGDFDGVNGLANETDDPVTQANVYDDFVLLEKSEITQIYTNNLSNLDTNQAYWEIRKDVSANNAGTLVAGGFVSTATVTLTGRNGFGFDEYTYTVDTPGVVLDAFTLYWITVSPYAPAQQGRSFQSTTSGLNAFGGPIGDGNAYFNSSFFGANYESTPNVGNGHDFSFGVNGQAVPEPASFALIGLGALALKKRRK